MISKQFGNNQSENKQHIFAIPVFDQYLVYNPLNGRYALLRKDGLNLLKKTLVKPDARLLPEEFKELAGFMATQARERPEKTGAVNPHFLGIIPSRECNMACTYCDFGTHRDAGKKLDAGLMVTAIDWFAELRMKNKQKSLPIQFFGGEPFVEQELLDIAIHHARFLASRIGLIPHFEALSNGYFNETQLVFVKDYFDRIIISLDGFQKFHDVTRVAHNNKSTFNQVVKALRYLSEQPVGLSIRCCITSESVHEMEAMADWFCSEFKPDKVNFEVLTENNFTRKAGLKPPEPYVFAVNCLKSWNVLRKYGVEPANASVALNQPQTTSCPVGRDVVIVHPGGILASCYVQEKDWLSKGLDFSVGTVHDKSVFLEENKLISLRNQLDNKPRCRNCFCRFGCAGGCHLNNTFPGSSPDYEDYCIQTRIITLCSLLYEMGESDLANELIENKEYLEKPALQKTDRLLDFED
jgi:uncharacterized protein